MLGTAERVHGEQWLGLSGPVVVVTAATYQMKATDRVVWGNAASNTVDITLPSKVEAAGKIYCIAAVDVSNDVSVIEKENATEITTYGDLDTVEDVVLLYCTGREWAVIWSSIT
jgi:hypothetical protein